MSQGISEEELAQLSITWQPHDHEEFEPAGETVRRLIAEVRRLRDLTSEIVGPESHIAYLEDRAEEREILLRVLGAVRAYAIADDEADPDETDVIIPSLYETWMKVKEALKAAEGIKTDG